MGKKRSVEAEPMQQGMLESVRCDVEDKDCCRLTGMACASCVHYMALFMEELEFWSWKLIRRDYVMVGLRQRFEHVMGAIYSDKMRRF